MTEQIKEILSKFGINGANKIEQIYISAWNIDNKYILKRNTNLVELDKSVLLCDLLVKENIPVVEYLKTLDGKPYYSEDDANYCLMTKMAGNYFDPYSGNPKKNGILLGKIVASLHLALCKIGDDFSCYDANYIKELAGWIMEEIKVKNILIRQEIVDECFAFEPLYSVLPRQLIHRDMHMGNLIFENDKFVGYLDFDISQKNVRILDVCYLGASLLVGNYQNADKLKLWREIFNGILTGYNEISTLFYNERKAIPNMFILIELTFVAFFSKTGHPELSLSCIDMTDWLYDNRKTFKYF